MDIQKYKKAKVKTLHKGQFIRFVVKHDWEYIERHNCTGIAIIVALTEDNNVLLVEQYRPPVAKNVIEFPAGLINDRPDTKTESLKAGAKRELLEETGYRAKKLTKLTHGPVSAGSSGNTVTIFLAEGLSKVAQGGGDESESIIIHEIPLNKVDQWLIAQSKKGRLIEPKIYTGLYFLKNYNR